MCSFVLHLLVLAFHECSGFAPHSSVQTPRDKPTAVPTTATASHGTMDSLALFATDATAELSTAPTVTSSYSQKFRAESEASGRVLTKHDQKWWARFGELEEYKREVGDCNVPQKFDANPQLGKWVFNQRQNYNKNNLSSERIEALESIGFEWTRPKKTPDDALWWKQLQELEKYKREHGDTLVQTYARGDSGNKHRELGEWVQTQRTQYRLLEEGKHSLLTDERIRKLNQIGFVWSAREAAWEEKFAELVEFKATHDHTDVPSSWEDQELFWWVSVQRREYRKLKEGKMTGITKERIERLEDIGFEWKSKRTYEWKIRLDELRGFYDENGVVPIPRAKHPVLYRWTYVQKKEYDKFVKGESTNMDEARIADLKTIGFFDVYGIKTT